MVLIPDPLVIANLLLCIIIIVVSIWSYHKTDDPAPLYVGAAFALFGITHVATLLGFKEILEPALIMIRILAYLIVILGLGLTARILFDRRNAEQALRENEAKYRALFTAELDAIIVIDKENGVIQEANASASALYGYTPEELRFMHITDLSDEPEKTRSALAQEQARVMLRYHRKKDGTVFPVEVTMNTFQLGSVAMMVCAVRDISEHTRTLQALLQANRKLHLLSTVTRHDINNQLTSLSGNLELAKQRTSDTTVSDFLRARRWQQKRSSSSLRSQRNTRMLAARTPSGRTLTGSYGVSSPSPWQMGSASVLTWMRWRSSLTRCSRRFSLISLIIPCAMAGQQPRSGSPTGSPRPVRS